MLSTVLFPVEEINYFSREFTYNNVELPVKKHLSVCM